MRSTRAVADGLVRLDNLAAFEESSSPPELYRYNSHVAATISGTLAGGMTMSDGIAESEQAAHNVLDERFTTAFTGSARDYLESSSSLGWVFMLALALIYLVRAAQFESFPDPLVILQPCRLRSLAPWWPVVRRTDAEHIFADRPDHADRARHEERHPDRRVRQSATRARESADPGKAVQEAATARLRPILMTSLATVLGILPIALAIGAGSESRVSTGVAVIGGLVCGTLLTLFVVPAMYLLSSAR